MDGCYLKALERMVPEAIQVPGYFLEVLNTPFWITFFRVTIIISITAVLSGGIYLSVHSRSSEENDNNTDTAGIEGE